MVEILGKRNRKVPVILTTDVKDAITAITSDLARKNGCVSEDNRHVFAVNDGKSTKNLRGNDVIRKACQMVKLEHANLITSTNMRKYVATVSQLVDMNESEMGWLAKHMGHDIHVHKEFYRMQESTLELAVVGNLLLAIDEGRAHQFKGRNLRDITLDGMWMTRVRTIQ